MKLLNATTILIAIRKARKKYANGTLNKHIQSSTVESFWFEFEKSSIIRKKQLIQMAKNGENRPHSKKHPLGTYFNQYTHKSGSSYDQDFTRKIRSIAPHWLIKQADIVNKKKQELIKIAQNKEPRPITRKHPLGVVLSHYTTQSNKTYDAQFTQKLKKLAPNWFAVSSDIKKQQLIQIAKN